jgi:hypothetical protein
MKAGSGWRGGRKVLGSLVRLADRTLAEVTQGRGGCGAQVNRAVSRLVRKPVGDVANLAAQGNAEARTTTKIVKEAARLAQNRSVK